MLCYKSIIDIYFLFPVPLKLNVKIQIKQNLNLLPSIPMSVMIIHYNETFLSVI